MKYRKVMVNCLATVFTAAVVVLIATVGQMKNAGAQGIPPQLLLNWSADTYVPEGFPGKVLPSSDSAIIAGLDMVSLGKRVDLSGYKVFWYVNNRFYKGGVGLTSITLNAPHFIGATSITLRVSVTDYPGGPGKTVVIPVVVPEAVIQSSASVLSPSTAPFNLQAYPYFFNVDDPSQLSFSWSLNGAEISTQNPFTVTREMADRGRAKVKLGVRNPQRPIERITQEMNIF